MPEISASVDEPPLGDLRLAANQAMDDYAAGDDAGFDRLYALVANELWGFIFGRVRSPADAEDVMQQTLLQLHRSRGRYRVGANVHPWMFTIAWRLIIDRKRRSRDHLDVQELALSDRGAQPDDRAHAAELGARLESALLQLPERQRVALDLVRAVGLSHKETAEVLGTTESAVKSLLHRALATLREVCPMEEA